MDTVVITHPIQTITQQDLLGQIVGISTLVLGVVAIVGLGLTTYQTILSRRSLNAALEVFKAQKLDLDEQHTLRLKDATPWFRGGAFVYSGAAIRLSNTGGKAFKIEVVVDMLQGRNDTIDVRGDYSFNLQPTFALFSEHIEITPIRKNGQTLGPTAKNLKGSFVLRYEDTFSNRYYQRCRFASISGSDGGIEVDDPVAFPLS